MKSLAIFTAGSLALATPLFAADDTQDTAEVAAKTIKVSTVLVKGGG